MSDTLIVEKTVNPKAEEWAERIAAQQRSGISVKQFCRDRGLTEYSFYAWRKRLQESGPMRSALRNRSPVASTNSGASHWRRGRTQLRLATAMQNAAGRSRRRNWGHC